MKVVNSSVARASERRTYTRYQIVLLTHPDRNKQNAKKLVENARRVYALTGTLGPVGHGGQYTASRARHTVWAINLGQATRNVPELSSLNTETRQWNSCAQHSNQ